MPNDMSLCDWLGFLDREYLSTFIKDGGASIKFAVTQEALKPQLRTSIVGRSKELDYIVIEVDAAVSRVHMPQDIFFRMASQVDWRILARRLILRLASDRGHQVDGIDPDDSGNIFEAIGESNGLSREFVYLGLSPQIQDMVYRNPQMAKDFRVAMAHLCIQEDTREDQEYGGQPIIDWLTGNNTRVSSVRPFLIYNAINRTTARHFIESAVYWFHYVGHSGTVILLDNSRVTLARNPRDGLRYYTRAMVTEHYELLREFVDGADRLLGTLIVVATNSEFLDEDSGSRGFGIYEALMTRVMDDVRDRTLVNPIASIVRLT